MGLLNFFKKAFTREKEIKINFNPKMSGPFDSEIDPIYKKKLSNGLLPGEIVLIDWVNGKNPGVNKPRYFELTYGLNADESINKLINSGYLRESDPYESLSSLKVPELKDILKQKGLKQSGKKADLIKRIKENLTSDEVSERTYQYVLIITELGIETLEQYYYIVPAHRKDSKDGIYNVATVIKFIENQKGNYRPSNNDISWALFQKAYMKEAKNLNYGLMRNIISNMANQLKNEEKFEDALYHYLRVHIIDTSGLNNNKRLLHPNIMTHKVTMSDRIENLILALDYSENDLKVFFDYVWSQEKKELLFHYLTKEESFEALLKSFDDNEEEFLKQITLNSYDRLNKHAFEKTYGIPYPVDHLKGIDYS